MGDPRRIRRTWEGARNPWRVDDLREGLRIIGEYGLRNKRELYKAQTVARRYRKMARETLALSDSERIRVEKDLVSRLYKSGLLKYENATSDNILSLTAKDILERRLQTLVFRKGLAPTIHAARQMVVHRHITIGDRIVDIPGMLVSSHDESQIRVATSSPFYAAYQEKIKAAPNQLGESEA
jgi:small subunit ribosomal protein S4